MSLKEKLVSSFLAFELDADINSDVHDIRSKSIKEFEKIGFPDKKDEYWKYTPIKKVLNEKLTIFKKKRNEIFQMAMLNPTLAILDETDSGLDIDALRIVANGVNKLRNENNAIIVITHYQRLLDHIIPDYVHVLQDGKIAKSGDKNLALQLEEKGYDWI